MKSNTNPNFPPMNKENIKLISWNVNGIRACCEKGFREAFNNLDADFFCLQETKMQEGHLDLEFPGYK